MKESQIRENPGVNEIELRQVLKFIWTLRVFAFGGALAAGVLSFLYLSLLAPHYYRSDYDYVIQVLPTQLDSSEQMSDSFRQMLRETTSVHLLFEKLTTTTKPFGDALKAAGFTEEGFLASQRVSSSEKTIDILVNPERQKALLTLRLPAKGLDSPTLTALVDTMNAMSRAKMQELHLKNQEAVKEDYQKTNETYNKQVQNSLSLRMAEEGETGAVQTSISAIEYDLVDRVQKNHLDVKDYFAMGAEPEYRAPETALFPADTARRAFSIRDRSVTLTGMRIFKLLGILEQRHKITAEEVDEIQKKVGDLLAKYMGIEARYIADAHMQSISWEINHRNIRRFFDPLPPATPQLKSDRWDGTKDSINDAIVLEQRYPRILHSVARYLLLGFLVGAFGGAATLFFRKYNLKFRE